MKITNKGITQTETGVIVNLRIEQQMAPFNSFDQSIQLSSADIEELTNDEIVTMAVNRIMQSVIEGFELVGMDPQEKALIQDTEGFTLIVSRPKLILISPHVISKELTKAMNQEIIVTIISQYGQTYSPIDVTPTVELVNPSSGVTLSGNKLTLETDEIQTLNIKASLGDLHHVQEIQISKYLPPPAISTEERITFLEDALNTIMLGG